MSLLQGTAELAQRVARSLLEARATAPPANVQVKQRNDFVTEHDHRAQAMIIEGLHALDPSIPVLAEEMEAERKPVAGLQWIVDPLDGTTNFIHDLPLFAVSIGLVQDGHPVLGVIAQPHRKEVYTAEEGKGAFLNGAPIRVSQVSELGGALTATGFPFKVQDRMEEYLVQFRRVMGATSGVRRMGSAAIDLAYVACGRFELFWELGLAPWDMAAGAVLVREAGGWIGAIDGSSTASAPDAFLWHGDLAATNGALRAAFLELLET